MAWARTSDGWAVNLDGSDASDAFSLPRIELHSGPRGWTAVCHLEDGTTQGLPVGAAGTAAEARRVAVAGAAAALGERWNATLRSLA